MSDQDPIHAAALAAGVWAVIKARAGEMEAQAKDVLKTLPVGDTVSGRWEGQILAKATMVKGRTTMVVTDPIALLEWVKKNHPTETVESVNPAFMSLIEKRAKELGQPVDWDGALIPGLEMRQGDPYVSVKKQPDATEMVAQLFKSGQLSLEGPQ